MNPALLRIVYRPSIGRAARAGLAGRNRSRCRPEAGRFTNADVSHMLERVWASYDELAPAVPRGATVGSRMNLLLSCMTYACLRALLSMGVERSYAIELIGDVAWKLYEKWGRLPHVIARIGAHDPREQMRIAVNLFLRFPFGPAGLPVRAPAEQRGRIARHAPLPDRRLLREPGRLGLVRRHLVQPGFCARRNVGWAAGASRNAFGRLRPLRFQIQGWPSHCDGHSGNADVTAPRHNNDD